MAGCLKEEEEEGPAEMLRRHSDGLGSRFGAQSASSGGGRGEEGSLHVSAPLRGLPSGAGRTKDGRTAPTPGRELGFRPPLA